MTRTHDHAIHTAPAPAEDPAPAPAGPEATPPGALLDIPLEQIMEDALTRDRAELDEAALWELQKSIAANGLRMPIEVFELAEPEPPLRYGLLSGYRRLRAFHALNESRIRYPTIPAFLRTPQSMAECLAAMVEENEIRAEISPWERGRIACQAVREGVFGNVEEAIAKLFPAASRQKRWRIRCLAQVVEELDGSLAAPETLALRQMLRIFNACQSGLGDVIRAALDESSRRGPADQWRLIEPILFEAENQPADALVRNMPGLFRRPDRPRRLSRPRSDLVIRRERTRDGYSLHFTGSLATSDLLDTVFDEIDRMFAPA